MATVAIVHRTQVCGEEKDRGGLTQDISAQCCWTTEALIKDVNYLLAVKAKQSPGAAVSYHRASRLSHLGSHQCHHKVSRQAGRWWSHWHTHGATAYTPVLHSCPHRSCPRSHYHHRTPRLCWCSVLRTESLVTLNWLYLTYLTCLIRSLLTRVPAAKLDSWVTRVRHAFTVLLIAKVHAVRVTVAAPAQGDAQAIHSTLKLISVTTSRGTRGCGGTDQELKWHYLLPLPLLEEWHAASSLDNVQHQKTMRTITKLCACKLDGN